MKSTLPRFILFISILLLASLACQAVTDIFEDDFLYSYKEEIEDIHENDYEENLGSNQENAENSSPPTDNKVLEAGGACPTVLENILDVATEFYEDDEAGDESEDEPEQTYLITYNISGNQINEPIYYEDVSSNLTSYQEDWAGHQEIWNYFITLIPSDERSSLAEYSIVTDGEGNVLASVAQTVYDPALWSLEVDIRDSDDKLNLTYTLIHEYAHLLTLGPNQVIPSEAVFNNPDDDDIYYNEVSGCPNYFPGEGCSRSNSYINAFFDEFWADIHEEWQDINLIEDDDAYYEALDDFYYNYEDRFVTNYAATNPEEDIAEAFTFFVLSPRPKGDTVTDEKIQFFYSNPELVQLREEIITGICTLNQ
jgi:hypothetical protein